MKAAASSGPAAPAGAIFFRHAPYIRSTPWVRDKMKGGAMNDWSRLSRNHLLAVKDSGGDFA